MGVDWPGGNHSWPDTRASCNNIHPLRCLLYSGAGAATAVAISSHHHGQPSGLPSPGLPARSIRPIRPDPRASPGPSARQKEASLRRTGLRVRLRSQCRTGRYPDSSARRSLCRRSTRCRIRLWRTRPATARSLPRPAAAAGGGSIPCSHGGIPSARCIRCPRRSASHDATVLADGYGTATTATTSGTSTSATRCRRPAPEPAAACRHQRPGCSFPRLGSGSAPASDHPASQRMSHAL